MENNENRYLINLIYQQPIAVETTGQMQLILKASTLGYKKLKEAKEAYNRFNKTGIIEINTPAGVVSLRLILVEFLDTEQYKLEEEQNEGNNEGRTEGKIDNADDEGFSNPNESETE